MQNRNVEINNQTDAFAGQLEVGKQLRLVYTQETLNQLQFYDDLLRNNKLDAIEATGDPFLIDNRKFHLGFKRNIA